MSNLDIFVGRDPEIRNLKSKWHTNSLCLVYGLRSIGKSTLVKKYLKVLESSTPEVSFSWIDMRSMKHLRQVYISLIGSLSSSQMYMETDWMEGISQLIQTTVCKDHVIIFDNAEDIIEGKHCTEFQKLCEVCISSSEKVKVIVTSTAEVRFENKAFSVTLAPLSPESSAELLQTCAPSVEFGTNLATIVNLCGGFPLAILMTSAILEDRDSLFDVADMVELLQLYRLKVLSQDVYQRQERIAVVYGEFLKRLSGVLTTRLSMICYIPGPFTVEQATEMVGHQSEEETERLTLDPVMRHHVIHYDECSRRYDVHGLLRDCIEMFQDTSRLPETRKRFCQIFSRLIISISEKVDSSEYMEGLCLYNAERQNFQKLLTDVMYTNEDTYGLYMELALRATNVIHKFMGDAGVEFFHELMRLCQSNKNYVDEARVRIQYGSMLTNIKGSTSLAEEHYIKALDVLNAFSKNGSVEQNRDVIRESLALAYQRIGWNIGSQGRWQEALLYLEKALRLEEDLHMYYEELAISTIQTLSVFNIFLENLDLGLRLCTEALNRRKAVYGTEEHPNVAMLINNQGLVYRRLGQKDKCLECFLRGLSLKRKTKATPKSLAISYENVALASTDIGNHKEAHRYLKEAYILLNKSPSLYADNRAYAYSVEGEVLQNQVRHVEAISRFKAAVSILIREAPDQVLTSKLYFEIANSYFALENYSKAIDFYMKVTSLKEIVLREAPTCDRLYRSYTMTLECHALLGDDGNKHLCYNEALHEAARLIQALKRFEKYEKVSMISNELQTLKERFRSDETKPETHP
ncbi:uncharacterized protein LOC117327891 [Pecten maximus]|uniref:uncharacterized protein LOC117327891 n=1 Tax=Pecten maximus TaxID=6579 RepID=UPI0014583C2E|nr:uncharacterized protein LOC117327891 [Pecten maximus]